MPEPFADAEAEFCRLIGAFLMEFSQLETMIQARLAQAIELPEEFSTCTQSKFLELGTRCTGSLSPGFLPGWPSLSLDGKIERHLRPQLNLSDARP